MWMTDSFAEAGALWGHSHSDMGNFGDERHFSPRQQRKESSGEHPRSDFEKGGRESKYMSGSCQNLRDAICSCGCESVQPCFPSAPNAVNVKLSRDCFPWAPSLMAIINWQWMAWRLWLCVSCWERERVNFRKVHVNWNKSEKIRGVIKEEKHVVGWSLAADGESMRQIP